MLVASIDVGIVNLALVVLRATDAGRVEQVIHAEVADTRVMEHRVVSADACLLGHTKTATDRLTHFVQERAELLDACDVVLIERQPIHGHTDVQEVLFLLLRAKAVLVSPNAMHKHFDIQHFTYEGRKQRTVEFADAFFAHLPDSCYHQLQRKHDIADALCLALFWLHQQAAAHARKVEEARARTNECGAATHTEAVANFAAAIQKYARRAPGQKDKA